MIEKKKKVSVVITARASYARIKSVLNAIQEHPDLELQIIAGASLLLEKYGTGINVIENDGFTVSAKVYMVLEGENPATMAKTTGIGLVELPTIFNYLQPDIVLTVADRFETIATAIAASYMNIPIAHIQGGEITGSIDEKVRHAVTKLSNYHFVSNEQCAQRVIKMGEHPDTVFATGCPSIDIAKKALQGSESDFTPFEKYGGVGASFNINEPYLIVMQHPVTTEYNIAQDHITETLQAVYELKIPTFWFWPNVDAGSDKISKGIRVFREKHNPALIHFFKNMSPEDFLRLLLNSKCIVGNSSVGIRESSYLGVPTVNIGTRQHGRDRGKNVIDVNNDRNEIKQAIIKQLDNGKYPSEYIYGDGTAGKKIADIISNINLTNEKKFYHGN